MPSLLRGGGVIPATAISMAGACRFSTASPLPRYHIPSCGGWDYEAYEDSLTFTRPVFPLPAIPGWNENGFGVSPGLCTPQLPVTHTEAGTVPVTLDRVYTFITLNLHTVQPLTTCDFHVARSPSQCPAWRRDST